jgi:hypothetical protein
MATITKELFEALSALCSMWDQYCQPPLGHMCMCAGEETEEVLDKYDLLINKDKCPYGGEVDQERLMALEKEIA